MKYNDGISQDINKITDVESAIDDFSEGDANLKDILYYLYNNNIETMASCKGHIVTESLPYISISIKLLDNNLIKFLLFILQDKDVNILYNKGNNNSYFSISAINFNFNIFKYINDMLKEFNNNINYDDKLSREILKYLNIVKIVENDDKIIIKNSRKDIFQFNILNQNNNYFSYLFTNNKIYVDYFISSGFKYDKESECFYAENNLLKSFNNLLNNIDSNELTNYKLK